MYSISLSTGVVLVLVQLLAAAPWVLVWIGPELLRAWTRQPRNQFLVQLLGGVGVVLAAGLGLGFVLEQIRDRESLENYGRLFGSILHLQLIIDVFILGIWLLLQVWPKGGAVALAAFREGVRQPMFWVLALGGLLFMIVSPWFPYWTFGEDMVMLKELGYDTVMLLAAVFGVLAASSAISEEIEGRTAITLLSKPVSRRAFLLGKFAGILLASLVMVGLLGWLFNWMVLYKHWFDKMDPTPVPAVVNNTIDLLVPQSVAADFLRGGGIWIADSAENLPGLILGFCQIMVLIGVAVALATRLPMVVNIVVCLAVYFLGHLSPVLSEIARGRLDKDPNNAGIQMLNFMASLFYNVLPGLEFFSVGPALMTDSPPPLGDFYVYVGQVTLYGVLYTSILLIVGLVLFEDRDLA